MIGVDTNVLLRSMLEDDPDQSPTARAFLEAPERQADPILLNAVVLVELIWVLGRRSGYDKDRLLAVLDALLASEQVVLSERSAIARAVSDWRGGRADFSDYLIGALNGAGGAATTVTFDRDAALHPAFSLLG